MSFRHRICAELLPSAGLALEAGPDGVELVHRGIDQGGVVGEDTGLEVAIAGAFHAETGAGEVRGADVSDFQVEDDDLEMDPRAKDSLQAGEEDGIMVKIFAEVGAGFLGVDQANLAAFADQVGQDAEEGTVADIQVFDVGGPDPQMFLHVRNPGDDFLEMGFVCNVLRHVAKVRTYANISE